MSILSVRLPRELDQAIPKRDRSAWVLEAVRERLRRERIELIARSAAEHAHEDLEVAGDWEHASEPLEPRKSRRNKR